MPSADRDTNMYTAKEVATKARAAYDAGTLIPQVAQTPLQPDYELTIGGKTCNCAIGAALSPEDLQRVLTSQSQARIRDEDVYFDARELVDRNLMDIASEADISRIADIQEHHDIWCLTVDDAHRPIAESNFVALLDRTIAQ